MKKIITLMIVACAGSSFAQSTVVLDEGNCAATVSDVGYFFNNLNAATPGYEAPKGGGTHAIFSGSFWAGGTDVNGQLKLAAQKYHPQQSFWTGALSLGTAEPSPNPISPQTLWMVSKAEIENHIQNFQSPGYVMPDAIMNWPAHGDMSMGQAQELAPFVDANNDGAYSPGQGDYPCIRGDKAVFTLINDKGGVSGIGADPVGLEIHALFYQYSSVPGLEDVTFIDARFINRSTQSLSNYYTSFFMDSDVGGGMDDYVGCDSSRNLIYSYNADLFDGPNGGVSGYEDMPAAIGLVCLNADATFMGAFSNGNGADPTTPVDFYNLMRGKWTNGTNWLDNNGQVTSYLYSGDPNDANQWSEVSVMNAPGDRRMLMSIEDTSGMLLAGEEYTLSFAVVFAQSNDNLVSVQELFDLTDDAQDYYDNSIVSECSQNNVGLNKINTTGFALYPNPSGGTFKLELPEGAGTASLSLIDMSGRIVAEEMYTQGGIVTFTTNAQPGVYMAKLVSNRGEQLERIVIE